MKPEESFIAQPIRSLQTMLRILARDNKRMPTLIPDGIYGAITAQAVTVFQRENDLPVTGTVNEDTWDAIVDAYEQALIRAGKAEPIEIMIDPGQVFRLGDTSAYIFLLQSMLTQLSIDHPSINAPIHNGILDEITAESLSNFQLLAGLPVTGELDKITWKHLVRQFSLNVHHHNSKTEIYDNK